MEKSQEKIRKEHPSWDEVVDALKESGYDIRKVTPTVQMITNDIYRKMYNNNFSQKDLRESIENFKKSIEDVENIGQKEKDLRFVGAIFELPGVRSPDDIWRKGQDYKDFIDYIWNKLRSVTNKRREELRSRIEKKMKEA